MIRSSRSVKTAAFSAAIAAHVAGLFFAMGEEEVLVEGGAGAVAAQIGNSFADLTAGVSQANEPDEIVENTTPTEVANTEPIEEISETAEPEALVIQTDEPGPTDAELVEETTKPTEPDVAEVEPEQPITEEAEPVQEVTQVSEPTKDVEQKQAELQLAALQPEPLPQLEATLPIQPVEEVKEIEKPEEIQPVEPEQEQVQVTRSLRPKTRSQEFVEQHKQKPAKKAAKITKKEKKTVAKRKPQGNSDQNAQKGATTASKEPASTSQGRSNSNAQGNAAASNYPGLVKRRIDRVRRPNMSLKGTAVVAFRVANNGALSNISLSRSSGSPKIDQVALRLIQKAAPFPPPPAGARRNFSIKIDVKGR
ncbi:MAG: TonB family protein [Pseudomonadota bacterium]